MLKLLNIGYIMSDIITVGADFSPNPHTNMTDKIKKNYVDTDPLAELVYIKAIKEQVEKRLSAKYLKRIDYLVNANNELMYELEQCELECYGRGY